jgi:manganese oxidase
VRFVTAALAAMTAVVHVMVLEDQFERATYLGALYLLVAVTALAVAGLLCFHDDRRVWLAAGVFAEVGAVALVVSQVADAPQITDDLGRWTAPATLLTAVLQVAVLGLTGWALSRHAEPMTRAASRFPLVAGLVALQVGAAATFATASVSEVPTTFGGPGGSGGTAAYWSSVAGAASPAGKVRTYFVSADEVAWNYAPGGKNQITGLPFDETANVFVKSGPGRIGSTYLKCIYRGYADATFRTPQSRSTDDAYLGSLGPVIRAAVGDTIKVVFRNTCRFPTSMHPHGVFYDKASEGAPYVDGTSGAQKLDDGVPQGKTHTYTWKVPERAGPGPHDGSSVMWMYHSHTDEVGDTYSGLMGPMVVTAAAQSRADGTPADVDRELFVLYAVMNENLSPYLKVNVDRYAARPKPDPEDEDFVESNLMHGINGYVYGNQPMITAKKGQHVRWYVMGMGTEVDLHTPHWHGNDVVAHGMRMDSVDLLPATMVVADMAPDNVGIWLFHCHVNDHLSAGMITRYEVSG